MRILGIDPGSRITGFGVIEIADRACTYVDAGCIKVGHLDMPGRLCAIYQHIGDLIDQHGVTEGAIEKIFMHKAADSALKLGHARGVAMLAMAQAGLSVHEYSAKQVKQSVVGYGGADKSQVAHMVRVLLSLPQNPQADAADALAIAMCHHHTQMNVAKMGGTKTVKGRVQ